MKYLLTILFCVSFAAFAQEPIYTPMRLSYQFRGIRVDSLFLMPSYSDTSSANYSTIKNVPGAMIRTGNDFWMRNAAADGWLQNVNIGSGASPILSFVNSVFKKAGTDSVFYVVAPSDTFFSFKDEGVDTTSLSNRINDKIENLKRSSDSVYYSKSGVWIFAYKDSVPIKDTPTLAMVLTKDNNVLANGNNFQGNLSGNMSTAEHANYFGYRAGANSFGQYNNYLGYEAGANSIRSGTNAFGLQAGYGNTGDACNFFGQNAGMYNNKKGVNIFGFSATADADNQTVFSKFTFPSPLMARISYNSITADRKYRLPDSSGTIALLENITGGGSNFANADLTATGNRLHNFKNYDLNIDSVKSYQLSFYPQYAGDYGSSLHMEQSYGNMLSYDDLGRYSGFGYNAPLNYAFLINKNNTAYLSRRAFGSDTLALLSDLTSLRKVDTIYRQAGKDSIFFKIAGTTYKIKDSTGGGGSNFANSDLTATGNRTHDFTDKGLSIDNISALKLRSSAISSELSEIYLANNGGGLLRTNSSGKYTGIRIDKDSSVRLINNDNVAYLSKKAFGTDTLAFKSDIGRKVDTIYRQSGNDSIFFKINGTTYRIKDSTGGSSAKKVDCTTFSTYNIGSPGVYNLYNTTTLSTVVRMPNPADFPGQSIFIVNPDASPLPFGGSYLPIDAGGGTVSQAYKTTANYVSDGFDWIIVL